MMIEIGGLIMTRDLDSEGMDKLHSIKSAAAFLGGASTGLTPTLPQTFRPPPAADPARRRLR
jgi:hypothetical protein